MDKHSYMYHNNHCHIHYTIVIQQHHVPGGTIIVLNQ